MIQPGEIQSIAGKEGVRGTQIEKDYVISWVTYGIANNSFLKENMVFKGGTVLKKVYFPDYRFSEDLDFTFTGKDFDIEAIKASFNELIEWVYEESRISLSIQNETQHETGNLNFYLAYTGPLGGAGANKDIKVDISQDELIYNAPEEKKIINTYSDLEEEYSIFCYSLGEVIAEKMRSIMQRTAPRDIYDLWYLFEVEGLDIEDHVFAFQDKTKHKGYEPKELTRVIEQKEKTFAKHWKDHLANQMTEIPDFNDVWRELGKHWRKFQKFIE
ncbi:MAG: nucleotidyl transferase AbiEii/AbiGii toxin family protein [Candidatus Latescibacteria bacterium]|nr:nucleotidyl transferase AbiEii/AbiGii toxin family protein [Candidatus Latescibacterota bacterium]